jgi:hypothetical protein
LVIDPARRPSVKDILKSPWIVSRMRLLNVLSSVSPTTTTNNNYNNNNNNNILTDGGVSFNIRSNNGNNNNNYNNSDINSYDKSQQNVTNDFYIPPLSPKFELAAKMEVPKIKKNLKNIGVRVLYIRVNICLCVCVYSMCIYIFIYTVSVYVCILA